MMPLHYKAVLEDTADLAVKGGRCGAWHEQELGLGKLARTSFYLGCLENKEGVCRFDAKPKSTSRRQP